jgi:hypothetical protein
MLPWYGRAKGDTGGRPSLLCVLPSKRSVALTNLAFITFASLGLTPPLILPWKCTILPPHRHPVLRKPSDRETVARAHCLGTDEFECGFHS